MKTLYLALALGGCGLSLEESAQSISGGDAAPRPGSAAVVFLGECSGVLVNATTLITAEHCLPVNELAARAPETISLALRRGARSETCLTPGDGGCGAWPLAIVRQPGSDVVALRSARPFAGVAPHELPRLDAPPAAAPAFAHGYGFDDGGGLGTRAAAPLQILQTSDDYIYARTPPGVRVCGGDSGGPLFAESAAGAVLLGVLSATQYDPANPSCTADTGLHRFARIAPDLLRAIADPASIDRAALAPKPGLTRSALAAQGYELIDPAGVSVERIDREQLVGLSIDEGDFLVRAPAATAPAVRGEGGGQRGELVPLALRAAPSLSNNGDQRVRNFVPEMGGVYTESSTARPGCTGTLIGRRIVRTAKHCTKHTARPWFTARYDHGPTTWTFDGGNTFVTFDPRQSIGHWYGGKYFSLGCDTADNLAIDMCTREDWALLIMAEDVWQPVHVIPKFMGIDTPHLGAVGNAGYPKCADMTTPNCVTGFMYGMACSIKHMTDGVHYTDCDTTPGHSGGGTYYTSGGTRFLVGNVKGGPSNDHCFNPATGKHECTTFDCGTNAWLLGKQQELRAQYSAVTL